MLKEIRGYTDLRHIGTGGFGEVYVARQEVINREVAIKVILPVHANRADFIQRFKFEAELIARLEHPHIVPLYDYWRDPDGAFLVMRYIRGGNLADRLLKGPLEIQDAARLLEQIAGALYVAHRNKVVHQDIKPANILLDEDGNAYLTDFGIARDIESNVNLAEDADNTMHGSPKYISPEHLRRKEITHRSDIYSLGILMYEVLTGKPPFDSPEMLQILQQHVRTPMPALQENKADLPPELNQPIQQATVKDPVSRYDNVMDFARDFQMVVTKLQYPTIGVTTIGIPVGASGIDATGPITVFNPYKGLKAFQESDAGDFYGREALVEELKKRMIEFDPLQRFLAVVGPSGSGKSSVVRAGLLPAIRRGDLAALPPVYITDMIPGNDPMRKLEGAILKVAHRATVELMETLSRNDYDLNQMLSIALPPDGDMLLIIDQFEEVFTLVNDEEKRRNFLNMMYRALIAENSRLRLIVTMRADFLDRPLEYEGWGDMLRTRMELVAPMKPSELQDAIEKPASIAGLSFEDGLTDLIINDVSAQAGVLPLLQYTLSELYERREGIELQISAYNELGGISGSLARRAEEIFNVLTDKQKEATRLFFPRLIRLGSGREHTRRRVMRSELYSLRTDTNAIRESIDSFSRYRLLTTDSDTESHLPTVEVAHEALIRSWERLQEWLRDNEDDLRLQARLAIEVEQWQGAKRETSFLPSGLRFQQYKTLINHESLALTEDELEFLNAALVLEEEQKQIEMKRQRRLRLLRNVIFAFGIIAGILAFVANNLRMEAENARDAEVIARTEADENAKVARARELASSSLLFADTFPDRAMLLGLQSLAVVDTFEGRNALMSSLLTQWRIEGYFNGHDAFVRRIALSSDGSFLASGDVDGAVIVWDAASNTLIKRLSGHEAPINGIAFSPDGHNLVSADADGRLILRDTDSWDEIKRLSVETSDLRDVTFSPDGHWLAAATAEGSIQLWNTDDFSLEQTLEGHDGKTIYDIEFSPDSSLLVSGGEDGKLYFWNMETFESDNVQAHDNWILTLAFSPDGTKLATGGLDQYVRVWDVESRQNLWASPAHRDRVTRVAFSSSGDVLISGDTNANIVLWDVARGSISDTFANVSQVEVRDFASLGNALYVAGTTKQIYKLNIGYVPRFGDILQSQSHELWAVASSGDKVAFAGGSTTQGQPEDYAVYIYDRATGDLQTLPVVHTSTVSDVLYWGNDLISVGLDSRVVIWKNGTEENRQFIVSNAIVSAAIYDNILALGLNGGDIELYDLSSDDDKSIASLKGHSDRVTGLDFDSTGKKLVSVSRDTQIILWDVENEAALLSLRTADNVALESVAMSPDGKTIATGGRDWNIILWDAESGEQLGPPLVAHEDWVTDLDFSPDGSLLASASADRSIILWDVQSQRLLGEPFIGHSSYVTNLAFSADGKSLVSVDMSGRVISWQTSLGAWEERACAIANRALTATEERDYFNDNFQPLPVCE